VFLRLGLPAFGGPVAHIAMMEDEAVVRRQWLMRERFLDLLGVPNLLDGPRCGHDAGRSQTAASAATVDDGAAAHPRRGSISKR